MEENPQGQGGGDQRRGGGVVVLRKDQLRGAMCWGVDVNLSKKDSWIY